MPTLCGGGAEKVLVNILKHFDYEKYTVNLCLSNNEGIYINLLPINVHVFNIYNNSKGLYRRSLLFLYRNFGFKYLLRKLVKFRIRGKYDSIISFMEGEALLYHQFVLDNGIVNITWVHTDLISNHWTKNFFYSNDERFFYSNMDKIIFVSNESKIKFSKLFSLEVPQKVIYNIIDKQDVIDLSFIKQPAKRKFTICTVGRLSEQKRYDRLIKIASFLKTDNFDIDIWILGEGILLQSLQKQVADSGLQDIVHFLGFKQPPYAYMKVSDVFISTSMAEGFPLVVCEALCLGLPIVSTKTSGPMELLDNNKYGILTEHDENSIYEALKQLIISEETRKYYAQMSLKRSELFDLTKSMEDIYQLFN